MKKLLYLLLLTSLAIKPDYASTTTTKRNKKNKKKLARRTKKISKSNARNSGGGATRSNAIGPVSQIKTTTKSQESTDPDNLLTSFDDSLFKEEQFGQMTKEELDKKEKIKKHEAKKNFIKKNQKKIEDKIRKEHPEITIDDLKKKTDDLLSSQFEDFYTMKPVEIKEANKPKAKTKEEIEEAIKSSKNKKTIKEKEKELKKLKNQEEAKEKELKKLKNQEQENEKIPKTKENNKSLKKLKKEEIIMFLIQKNDQQITKKIENNRLIYSYTKKTNALTMTNNSSTTDKKEQKIQIDAGTLYFKFTTSLFDFISNSDNAKSNQEKIENIQKMFNDTPLDIFANNKKMDNFINFMKDIRNISITQKSILYIIFSDILASIDRYNKKINESFEIKNIERELKTKTEKINNQIKELKELDTKETTGENNDQLKKLQGEISTLEKESNINIEKIKESYATTCINNIQENIIKPIKDKYALVETSDFLNIKFSFFEDKNKKLSDNTKLKHEELYDFFKDDNKESSSNTEIKYDDLLSLKI